MADQLPLFSTSPPTIELPPPAPLLAERAAPSTAAPAPPAGLSANSPLKAAIVAWRAYLANEGRSPNTVKSFGGDLDLFAKFTGAGKNIGQFTTRDLDNWLQWQRTVKKCSPKTYARRVTSLKSFFRWLHQAGVVNTDPAAPIIQQTVLSPLPEILTEAEVGAALKGAESIWQGERPDPTPHVLFTLLLQTGIKKAECLALIPNHVDLSSPDEPVLFVRHAETRHRYKDRKLPLSPGWLPAYQDYLAYREHYLPRPRRDGQAPARAEFLFPWSSRQLEYFLEDISNAAGLAKHISFDMCRWTCAVRDARAGMDFNQIRQKLGLSKIQWREVGMKLEKLVEGEH
ncbi:MAG: tyrosine-type recombinase/integrase [Anaerolineales bacterium]